MTDPRAYLADVLAGDDVAFKVALDEYTALISQYADHWITPDSEGGFEAGWEAARTTSPAMARALVAVLELHSRVFDKDNLPACRECCGDFPCETVTAITTELAKEDQE